MRFHVISLPHTNTTLDFTACAFTEKVRKFCIMMKSLGHTVYLYAGDNNEAPCDEHISCLNEKDRLESLDGKHYTMASYDISLPHWKKFNANVINGIRERAEKEDFICSIGGLAHKEVADALPHLTFVEFGIGYPGTFAKFRVFESYAWMHTIYGTSTTNAALLDGNFFDAVLPSYFEMDRFPFSAEPEDYYLFIGRLTERKGYQIAEEVCRRLGKRLIIAGQGNTPSYGEYVGVVGAERRAELFGGAIASFAPTIYVEPFGSVVPEAHACGTPTITTDWGAFPELVINGFNGYRCRTLQEFMDATEKVKDLDRKKIHELAFSKYSLEVVAVMYEEYFEKLLTLWGKGFYELKS